MKVLGLGACPLKVAPEKSNPGCCMGTLALSWQQDKKQASLSYDALVAQAAHA